MQYQRPHRIGPPKTPSVVKIILAFILFISIFTAIVTPFLKSNYLIYLFGISLEGIKSFFFWQFFTFSLLQPGYGLDFSFIIVIIFNLYIIWVTATTIVENTSQKGYLIFYIFSSIFTGLAVLLTMLFGSQNYVFANSTITLYATLIAWMMIVPSDTRIFLFFAIPIKHYWLVLGLIGYNLLSSLSTMQLIPFFAYLSVSLFAYFYAVIVWQRFSPFIHLNKMERRLIYISSRISQKFRKKP